MSKNHGVSPGLLALVHIAKTGGTTLIHLLRRNYLFRCLDVRPLYKASNGIFSARDLKTYRRLNGSIHCICGHSVKAYSDLETLVPDIRYVTILRDPVSRCISHYQQRVKKYGRLSMEEFLSREWIANFQTRAIAGVEDLAAAKQLLQQRIDIVGVVERFDELLAMLSATVGERLSQLGYVVRRVSHDSGSKSALREEYETAIVETQALDVELYEYVRNDLIPARRAALNEDFENALSHVRGENQSVVRVGVRPYLDYAYRKLYVIPSSSIVRMMNGLPAAGVR